MNDFPGELGKDAFISPPTPPVLGVVQEGTSVEGIVVPEEQGVLRIDAIDGQIEEIEEGLETAGEDVSRFVNNFEAILPEGMRWREVERDYDVLDAPLVDEESDAPDRVYHSERYLNGTTRQLFEDVERSLRSNDEVDPVRLRGLRDAYLESPEQSREAARNRYIAYALPIYRDLRIMGYSHYDLSQ